MSNLEKAIADAQTAEQQAERLEFIAAILAAQQQAQPVPVAAPQRPVVHVSGGAVAAIVCGVLVIGSVLVSMLLAIAVTAASVAVCAVVLRSMLNSRR